MSKNSKIITAICAVVVCALVIITCTFIIKNNHHIKNQKQPQDQKPVIDNDEKLNTDSKDQTVDNNDVTQEDSSEDKNHISTEVENNPSTGTNSNTQSGSNQTKPSKPTKPSESGQPNEPEKIEDLIITNSMIKDGEILVSNKKYNTLTVSSNIEENVKIVLDSIQVNNKLVLEKPGNYQLDIINSSLASIDVTNQTKRLVLRSRATVGMNKALDGATVNLKNGSTVQSISINSNIEINGTTSVTNVEVNSGSEVVLNVPIKNATLNTQGTIAINGSIDTLTNSSSNATIIVNAPINTFTNKESSTIRVNKGNTIKTFKNQGENTTVSGNGTIIDTTIESNNTMIYTNVTNQPTIGENIDNILIRKENKIEIVSAISNTQGSVTFTLSEPVNLTINDISVICNAGKSITLFNLTTTDNKTYTLTTSYYKNDSYALYITLPNGNIISRDFDTDYANPTVNNVVVERISDEKATLELYGVDEGGHIYYILEDNTTKEIISAESLKAKGKSEPVKVGYNIISIDNLEAGKSYNLYYVLEGYFDNIAKVKGPFEIPSQIKEVNRGSYQITYAKEEIINRFVFVLNKAPEKELTLSDFEIECPQEKNLTTNGATFITSPDRLTYILIVPDNYGHKDNKYTVKIKISENEKIEGTFVSHFNPPVITGAVDNVTRVDENTAEFTFNSDEPGVVYYGVYEWNGAIYANNSTTPFANDILTGAIESKQQTLNAGSNTITIDLTGIKVTKNTRVWALFIDEVGNYRTGFVDHYKLPDYVSPDKPTEPESTVQITNFNVSNNKSISIDFNESIDWVTSDDVKLSVVENGSLPAKLLYSIDNDTPKHLSIEIMNYTLQEGTYELSINTKDKNGTSITLVKRFEIK